VVVSRGQENVHRSLYVSATAYTSYCNTGCTGITATGENVQNSITYNGARIIAVDPSVIPLHSLVKVYPKDRPPFYAYAKDTGGAIKGNKIDYLISINDRQAANAFGRQTVKVEIIREGKGE
jgi:3D (Asp-Asp-Asp) domain-containing protein